ncbi:uncharacterized protein LOC129566399 [Sitodiplosis mosellana]|uniref:uncharacterized protein LOC129566399 n=1 Tax=Sitodiplosis mosellana TaxID=263140 RepID=UPI0024452958|nr:uncharacterized protein LOC129566399 [Sitodiplosis mosellana]
MYKMKAVHSIRVFSTLLITMTSPLYFGRSKMISHLILVSAVLTTVASNYESRQGLMNGLVFPSEIDAVVGEEIYLKIIEPVAQQTHCHYRKTGGQDVDIQQPHKQDFEAWKKETCGLRIKNITTEEHGFWRLTSSNDNGDVARGIVFINVRTEDPKQPAKKEIDSLDVDIALEQTEYCYVLRPDQTKTAFPQHENCDFPKFKSDAEGNGIWNVVSGVKGKTHEVTFEVNVKTNVEQFQTFVEHNSSTSSLNMKCKLVNTRKTLKFCRFLRLNDDTGFNLQDGRGEERISYFGNGFANRECGISIANADDSDKSPWKCFIGVDDDGHLKTMGAIIDGSVPQKTSSQGDVESSDVYGLQDTQVNILCKRYIPTDYCWFRDPSGQIISMSDQKEPDDSNDIYRYYGTGIKLGECGLTILNANHNHSGIWSCHMGATEQSSADSVQEISVRIAETPLVSTNLFQDAQQATSMVLECHSIPEHVPLEYCRFLQPDGKSFSINEKSTVHNPLLDNYYFNPNRKMSSGYCSIIVKKVDRKQHQGQWMCVAKPIGSDSECSDEFRVTVFDSNISAASVIGMVFSAIFILGGIVFITYRGYRQKYNVRRNTQQTAVTYITGTDAVSMRSNHSIESQSSSQTDGCQSEGIEIQTIRLRN